MTYITIKTLNNKRTKAMTCVLNAMSKIGYAPCYMQSVDHAHFIIYKVVEPQPKRYVREALEKLLSNEEFKIKIYDDEI